MLCSCIVDADDPYSVHRVWRKVTEFYTHMSDNTDKLNVKRAQQRVRLLYDYMYGIVTQEMRRNEHMKQLVNEVERRLHDNQIVPRVAAQLVLDQYRNKI